MTLMHFCQRKRKNKSIYLYEKLEFLQKKKEVIKVQIAWPITPNFPKVASELSICPIVGHLLTCEAF
jgi:hypothetical protein